jgi:hypothetical protein
MAVSLYYHKIINLNQTAMKTIAIILVALLPALNMLAQQSRIPAVDLRDINGTIVSSSNIISFGDPTLVVFWKSCSNLCSDNLDRLQGAWEEVLAGHGVKMIAVCVDCNGSWSQVKPIVYGNNWDFDTYIDVNGDFKRAMNVGDVPCTMLFDSEQNLVCRYNSACTGTQEFICNNIMDHLNISETAENYQPAE